MKRPLSTLIVLFICMHTFSQVEVRSTRAERMQNSEVKKIKYNAGFGAGYNQLQNSNSNFGFEIKALLTTEFEFFERIRAGAIVTAFLADVNQTVFLNNGSRFDTDRAPTGGAIWPYASLIVYKSTRLNIAPMVGYQWHFFGSEDIDQPEPFQGFRAKGLDYGLSIDFSHQSNTQSRRPRAIRIILNYSDLKINGQPESIQMYGISVQMLLQNMYGRSR